MPLMIGYASPEASQTNSLLDLSSRSAPLLTGHTKMAANSSKLSLSDDGSAVEEDEFVVHSLRALSEAKDEFHDKRTIMWKVLEGVRAILDWIPALESPPCLCLQSVLC
jgi:hypothetical protein